MVAWHDHRHDQLCTVASITLTLPASGASRESTAIDNTTNKYVDALVHVKFTAGTVATNKQALVWVYGSEDGTNYDGAATGTDAATPCACRMPLHWAA
jgi:hypothetical protein